MSSNTQEDNFTFDSYSQKRVSFILPTKNRASLLEKSLESFEELKGPDDELIIIDGKSEDHTREVIKKFGSLVDIFVSEQENNGIEAINKGFLLARGKYIKFVTDDDIYYHEGIEKAVKVMERHPEIDLLLCGGTKESGGMTWNYLAPPGSNYGKKVEDVFKYRGATGVGHFFRRLSLARLGFLYPTRVNSDLAFVLEFISRGGVVRFCRIKVFHHKVFKHSVVRKNASAHRRDTLLLARQYCSLPFYFWYRFRRFFRPLTDKLKFIFSIFASVEAGPAGESVWDGNFS